MVDGPVTQQVTIGRCVAERALSHLTGNIERL